MKKITTVLNSPAKIAGFAICAVIIIGLCAFGAIRVNAGINENQTIGMDKGVNVALADAGFKSEEVTNLTAHYDTEDGASVYEVSFVAGDYKYEYVVKASNGKIVEADRDELADSADGNSALENSDGAGSEKAAAEKSDQTQTQNSESAQAAKTETKPSASAASEGSTSASTSGSTSSSYIGVDKAKSIALSDAGLSASSVTFTKAKLDREDGVRVYEIEFFTQDKEYEYEISAADGTIRSKDIERNDDFGDGDWDDEWDD